MNMTLGKKVSSGFSAVLLITIILGSMSIYNMKISEKNAIALNEKYVPEVRIAGEIQNNFSKARIAAAKFIFTEDVKYYEETKKYFTATNKYIVETRQLVTEQPTLLVLKKLLVPLEKEVTEYQAETEVLNNIFKRKSEIRASLDRNAGIFMKEAGNLLDNQKRKFNTELKNNVPLKQLETRLSKIYDVEKVINLGADVRIANFKSAARRDASILKEGFAKFDELDKVYEHLRLITTKQIDIDFINSVDKAGNNYKQGLIELSKASEDANNVLKKLTAVGTVALKAVEDVYAAGLNGNYQTCT